MFCCPGLSEAGLYIDDVYTTDKGHLDIDFSLDYYRDIEKQFDDESAQTIKVDSKETDINVYASYGLADNWDIGITIPYLFLEDTISDKINGFSDIVIESKYRFCNESEILPGFAFYFDLKTDSANKDKGLGSGKLDYTLNNIFTKSIGDNVFDLNLGCIFVGGKDDDLFFYSFDASRDLINKLSLCAEIYGETDFKGDFDNNIFIYALSLKYKINNQLSFETGVGFGVSEASPDYQFSNTLTFTF